MKKEFIQMSLNVNHYLIKKIIGLQINNQLPPPVRNIVPSLPGLLPPFSPSRKCRQVTHLITVYTYH